MTTIDHSDHGRVAPGDSLRMLLAMLVYAGAVSLYITLSASAAARSAGIAVEPGSIQDVAFIGLTFASIVAYAAGFMLLAGLLDLWTGRSPQPLTALNLALPAVTTFELIKMPLLILAFQVWFWATTT
jgi:hypothetical protein